MNKTPLIGLLCATIVGCFSGNAIQAATIANWTFETSIPTTAGPLAPESGSGTGTSVHVTPNSFSNPSGNGSAESWNSDSWAIGDYYQFQVSTAGLSDIGFSWDQTRSSAGPGQPAPTSPNFRLQFSTDGSSFTNVVDYLVQALTWNSTTATVASQFSQDLSSFDPTQQSANGLFSLNSDSSSSELRRANPRGQHSCHRRSRALDCAVTDRRCSGRRLAPGSTSIHSINGSLLAGIGKTDHESMSAI